MRIESRAPNHPLYSEFVNGWSLQTLPLMPELRGRGAECRQKPTGYPGPAGWMALTWTQPMTRHSFAGIKGYSSSLTKSVSASKVLEQMPHLVGPPGSPESERGERVRGPYRQNQE